MKRHPDRRLRGQAPITVLAGLLAFLAIGVVNLGDGARAQGSHSGHNPAPAAEVSDVDAVAVAKPGALPEIVLGKPDAPITIIEYASITCGHCGRFHRELLPEVKKKYIDTGVARLFVREFPLESVAAAAALLVRCSKPDVQYKFLEALFQRQQQWLAGNDVRNALIAIAKEFGLPETEFEGCLKDEALFKKVLSVRTRANEEFGVNSTPTFFINGKALVGPQSLEEFDAIIAPLRAEEKAKTTK